MEMKGMGAMKTDLDTALGQLAAAATAIVPDHGDVTIQPTNHLCHTERKS